MFSTSMDDAHVPKTLTRQRKPAKVDVENVAHEELCEFLGLAGLLASCHEAKRYFEAWDPLEKSFKPSSSHGSLPFVMSLKEDGRNQDCMPHYAQISLYINHVDGLVLIRMYATVWSISYSLLTLGMNCSYIYLQPNAFA